MNEIDPNIVDEGDPFEGPYQLLNAIFRKCKEAMEDRALESALLLLREAVGKMPPSHELHSMAMKTLASASLVRYARHRSLEDVLEGSTKLLSAIFDPLPGPSSRPTVDQDSDLEEASGQIGLALELINDYGQSASMEGLNTAAGLYEIALSDVPLTDPARLPLLLAAADTNWLRNAVEGNPGVPELAVSQLEEALRLAGDGDRSMTFGSLISLGHTYCMKWLQDWKREQAPQAAGCLAQARQLDEEAVLVFDQGMESFEQFQEGGGLRHLEVAITQLEQSVLLRPPPHPRRSSSLNTLANALSTRFQQKGQLTDLEESIKHYREALELRPSPHPDRPRSLNNLGGALVIRFRQHGDLTDLEESIKHIREALEPRPSPHPDRSMSLNNLGGALSFRFERRGDLADLEESVQHNREALELRPSPHPDRSMSLNNLGGALSARFRRQGELADLEESIKYHREALGLLPSPHPVRSMTLINLGGALSTRFEQKGQLTDLEESIKHHRDALELLPSPHPDRSTSLNSLAGVLNIRFEQKGDLTDLEESIKHSREALELLPSPHSGRFRSLDSLTVALNTRFKRWGDLTDLEESITHHCEALELLPSPHPHRSGFLTNLAVALTNRFKQKGDLVDLEESIQHNREALELLPSPHPARSILLTNLAVAITNRFKQKGDLVDLEESIKHNREALGLLPSRHTGRFTSLNNLALELRARFQWQGDTVDLEESIKHHREALGLLPSLHPGLSTALGSLATALGRRFDENGDLADLKECIKHHREALELLPSPHPARSILLTNLAAALTDRFKQKGDLVDLEESIKHNREALELLPSLHPDRSRSLNNLALALLSHDTKSQDGTQNQAEAFSLFEQSASYPYGSLIDRFGFASSSWARSATRLNHPSALSAYQCAVNLLPQLASIHLDPQHRQGVLVHAKDLAANATRCAIEAGKLEDAVVFSSTARSVFWSQSLQLRSPFDELHSLSPQLAERLRFLSRALEKRDLPGTDTDSVDPADRRNFNDKHATYFRKLAEDWQQTLEEVRKHPGFEDFCKLPSFSSLRDCAKRGPLVLLNASERGCDALVITQDSGPRHIPLHGVTQGLLLVLSSFLRGVIAGDEPRVPAFLQDHDVTDYRKICPVPQALLRSKAKDPFGIVLHELWVHVASPVVDLLKLVKSTTPMTRIWWCPSGAFTFLPIHAAGIYAGTDSVCLHDYAVSSYCSSLQSLLASVAPIEPDYKFLAIIQPSGLPMTKVELEKIEAHLPQPHDSHLLKHVGVAGSPTPIDNVLSDFPLASFVHFGCHGKQESNPLESYLLLSGGRLTMSRIVQCQASKASLAYLSACETAQHDEDRPDESLHLAATMMFAGFRSVVATLWSIEDNDAPVVADAFYKHLFRHGSTQVPDVTESAYALHLGVKALRESPGVSFRQWVPFVHYGL